MAFGKAFDKMLAWLRDPANANAGEEKAVEYLQTLQTHYEIVR